MYALIITIVILSPATGAVIPVGISSQIVGNLKIWTSAKRPRVNPTLWGLLRLKSLKGILLAMCVRGQNLAARVVR